MPLKKRLRVIMYNPVGVEDAVLFKIFSFVEKTKVVIENRKPAEKGSNMYPLFMKMLKYQLPVVVYLRWQLAT